MMIKLEKWVDEKKQKSQVFKLILQRTVPKETYIRQTSSTCKNLDIQTEKGVNPLKIGNNEGYVKVEMKEKVEEDG